MPEHLEVTIPDTNAFYSLYADGLLARKTYIGELRSTVIEYAHNAAIVLYYTYPTHRTACLVRNSDASTFPLVSLPGLSRKVSLVFSVNASRVDKLKRAIGFLHSNFNNAFSHNDGFYIRLYCILRQRGKLNYTALRELAVKESNNADTL